MKLSLKQWRAMRNLTQAQLAEMSGISQAKIACIEALSPAEATKLREVLNLKATDSITMPTE